MRTRRHQEEILAAVTIGTVLVEVPAVAIVTAAVAVVDVMAVVVAVIEIGAPLEDMKAVEAMVIAAVADTVIGHMSATARGVRAGVGPEARAAHPPVEAMAVAAIAGTNLNDSKLGHRHCAMLLVAYTFTPTLPIPRNKIPVATPSKNKKRIADNLLFFFPFFVFPLPPAIQCSDRLLELLLDDLLCRSFWKGTGEIESKKNQSIEPQ